MERSGDCWWLLLSPREVSHKELKVKAWPPQQLQGFYYEGNALLRARVHSGDFYLYRASENFSMVIAIEATSSSRVCVSSGT